MLEASIPRSCCSPPKGRDGDLDHCSTCCPDVPAGKLAIAELHHPSRDDVAELERAGVDAVLVGTGDVGGLVDDPPPEV